MIDAAFKVSESISVTQAWMCGYVSLDSTFDTCKLPWISNEDKGKMM